MGDRLLAFLAGNMGTKVISVIVAIVLWIIVFGSKPVEITKEVPLEVITSPSLTVVNEMPESIAFRLAAPRAFQRSMRERPVAPIRLNLTNEEQGLVRRQIYPGDIRVPLGVRVLSVHPSSLSIQLDRVRSKEVPVKLELRGELPEGYSIESTEITPDRVRIRGPENLVNSISQVSTAPIDVSELRQNVEQQPVTINFADPRVHLESPVPRVDIQIQAATANFRLRNVEVKVAGAEGRKAVLGEKSVTVLVRAAPEDLKTLDRNAVNAQVDLQGLSRGRHRVPVQVRLPERIGLVKVIPETISVTLR